MAAVILNLKKDEIFVHRLSPRVKWYNHAKSGPNWMKDIQMPSRNVIYGVNFS